MKTLNQKQLIGQNFVNTRNPSPIKTTGGTNPLLASLIKEDNKGLTENSAPTFKSTLNGVLDFFSMGAALRTRPDNQVLQLFVKAYSENSLLATKALFNIRNIRGGAGERKTFRTILKYLGDNYPDLVVKNLDNIVKFGRYDDVYSLFGTKSEQTAMDFLANQLKMDVANYESDKPISLAAKWVASNNTSSAETRQLAYKLQKYLGWSPKQYRKTLSVLRAYLNVVEQKTSANEWSQIDYEKVPSQANLKYRTAFFKHDKDRYEKYIAEVKAGTKKVNAGVLFPYDIVEKILYKFDKSETLDVLWDNLPNFMEDKTRNILVVADCSGSMAGRPMATSIALAIYTSQLNTGPFGGYFITYSQKPVLQKVVGNNIREKIRCIQSQRAVSTNLQAVFEMLLSTARENNIKQSDMPEQVLIVSDMEFNDPQTGNTNLEEVRVKYKEAGYKCPNLVFWNVSSRQNNCPATANEKNVLLVSGSSPSVFKTLLSGKSFTPVDQMMATLNNEQYDCVVV